MFTGRHQSASKTLFLDLSSVVSLRIIHEATLFMSFSVSVGQFTGGRKVKKNT